MVSPWTSIQCLDDKLEPMWGASASRSKMAAWICWRYFSWYWTNWTWWKKDDFWGTNIFSTPKMGRFSSGERHWAIGSVYPVGAMLRRCLALPGILFFHLFQQVGLVLKPHPKRRGKIQEVVKLPKGKPGYKSKLGDRTNLVYTYQTQSKPHNQTRIGNQSTMNYSTLPNRVEGGVGLTQKG